MEQNEHIELGRINTLLVDRQTPPGLFLKAKDDRDILLPNQYCKESMQPGTLLEVFVYTDSEDRPVATTQKPKAMLDEFALFEVVDFTKFGAFVDWGLAKDLFVPKKLQKQPFKIGEKKLLRVVKDEQTERLIGTQKFDKYLSSKTLGVHKNAKVTVLIYEETPLGFKCLVENQYRGLIFRNEVFETLHIGDKKEAYVKNIRGDGNLDISLQKIGAGRKKDATENILDLLKENSGSMPYNSKSDPELITKIFGMSKKTFKASLTTLKEKDLIEIKETGIYLK